MSFESMGGTAGVVSDGNTLFIANSSVITTISRLDKTEDIPHAFDYIEAMCIGPIYLSGIYVKNDKYGIFLMNLKTRSFTTKYEVDYNPSTIKTLYDTSIYVIDTFFNIYEYDAGLNLKTPAIPKEAKTNEYTTADAVVLDNAIYFIMDTKMYSIVIRDPVHVAGNMNPNTENEVKLPITENILTALYFNGHLLIFYMSQYNLYSILQYDTANKKVIKTIDGGYITNPLYACIHRNSLYISSTTNKIIPLSRFDIPGMEKVGPPPSYSLFELQTPPVNFIEEELKINPTKLKEKKESLVVDIKPAESNLFYYYVWFGIAAILFGLIVLTFTAHEKRTINLIILLILLVTLFFILRRYI